MKKSSKQLLFERMHTIGGMPLKEFSVQRREDQAIYQNIIDFIGESNDSYTYLHTTNSEENAKSICQTGFRFMIFEKTTDVVTNVDALVYMLGIRRSYGNFTVIIQINKSITNYESISKQETDEDDNEIFILPPQYVKGYYNRTTKGIYANPLFKK